jgi:hypothetical protein
MPKGPKGQRRPADVIGNAVRVMEIATGQRDEEYEADTGKDKAAADLGRKGGKARAERMTPRQRKEAARKAASARWAKSLVPSARE